MDNWKHAVYLAWFEIRYSFVQLLFSLPLIMMFSLFISLSTDLFEQSNAIFVDLLLIWLSFVPFLIRPESTKIQKINGKLLASPVILMNLTVPVPKDILIKSRIVISLIHSLTISIPFLFIIYLFSPSAKGLLSFGLYSVFMIVWVAFQVIIVPPTADIGQRTSFVTSTFILIAFLVLLIGFLYFLHFYLGIGIVHGSIKLIQDWPILTAITAILLIVLNVNKNQFYMKKQLKKIDYF